jgi:hypothetical protein
MVHPDILRRGIFSTGALKIIGGSVYGYDYAVNQTAGSAWISAAFLIRTTARLRYSAPNERRPVDHTAAR